MPRRIEQIAGLWFARGDQCPGWHYDFTKLLWFHEVTMISWSTLWFRKVTKFCIQLMWRHTRECINRHPRSPPPIIKFYGVFNHFSRTCEVAKSWTIKLYHCISDVIHANEQTKYVNCGLHVNFGIFCKCHFVLWWKRIILSKSCYFGLRSL